MSLGSPHHIPEDPTLPPPHPRGKALVWEGLRASPPLTEVTVAQLGRKVNFSKERPGLKTLPPSAAPREIIPANMCFNPFRSLQTWVDGADPAPHSQLVDVEVGAWRGDEA